MHRIVIEETPNRRIEAERQEGGEGLVSIETKGLVFVVGGTPEELYPYLRSALSDEAATAAIAHLSSRLACEPVLKLADVAIDNARLALVAGEDHATLLVDDGGDVILVKGTREQLASAFELMAAKLRA